MYITALNKSRFTWKRLLNVSGQHLYRDDSNDSRYNRVCSEFLNESIKSYVRIFLLQTCSLSIAMIAPLYGVLHGERVTLFSVKLPYLHQNPELEYMMNMCWETANGILGLIAFWSIEIMFVLVNNTIAVSPALFQVQLEQLANEIENKHGNEKYWTQSLNRIFMRIIYIDGYV